MKVKNRKHNIRKLNSTKVTELSTRELHPGRGTLHFVKSFSGGGPLIVINGPFCWTSRYPWIVEAARKNRHKQFVIDGEAVLLAFHGISDFDGLHSRQHDDKAQLYAVDILAMGGDDLRQLPSSISRDYLRARSGCSFVAFAMGLSAQ